MSRRQGFPCRRDFFALTHLPPDPSATRHVLADLNGRQRFAVRQAAPSRVAGDSRVQAAYHGAFSEQNGLIAAMSKDIGIGVDAAVLMQEAEVTAIVGLCRFLKVKLAVST